MRLGEMMERFEKPWWEVLGTLATTEACIESGLSQDECMSILREVKPCFGNDFMCAMTQHAKDYISEKIGTS